METDYYDFIQKGKSVSDDISIIPQEYLIPLKARAYLDLHRFKRDGKQIDSKDIKKHKNDVFRLYQILSLDTEIVLSNSIADDMRNFLNLVAEEPPDLKNLGIRNSTFADIYENMKKIFNL
jgi:hypothetical protein